MYIAKKAAGTVAAAWPSPPPRDKLSGGQPLFPEITCT